MIFIVLSMIFLYRMTYSFEWAKLLIICVIIFLACQMNPDYRGSLYNHDIFVVILILYTVSLFMK